MSPEPVLVMMAGPPGAGKSTLAASLCTELGVRAMLLAEEAVFERPEFAAVGEAFRTKTFPDTDMMLAAYTAIFASAHQRTASIVADWSCVGMIEDLPCAQPDRASVTSRIATAVADRAVLESHARDVRLAWGGRAILLVLDVPIGTASRRVVDERGAGWVKRHLQLGEDPSEPIAMLAARERSFRQRKAVIIDAHGAGGWTVQQIHANRDPEAVVGDALHSLHPYA